MQKLRKALKTRRVTAVSQIGTDRIIEFQFSDGQYKLYLEFFASGNVILTDKDLKIITLLRNVPEGEGQEPQRPGLSYSLANRQNFGGVPDLTKERVRAALKTAVEKNAAAAAAGKKLKKKPGDELRRGLATAIQELPPILVDHALKVTDFDSTSQPAAILENEELLDHLLRSLKEARKVVEDITSSGTCTGYILAKPRKGDAPVEAAEPTESGDTAKKQAAGLLYDDFHPFLPRQFEQDPSYTVVTFDNFNKTVDEFFSSIEGQKLESKLSEKEANAKRKLEAARADQAQRIQGLQQVQALNVQKAAAIEANVERVQEAMDAVNGLLAQGMDWVDIGKLIEREQRRGNPVAEIIVLPLKLAENTITLLLGGEEMEVEPTDEGYDSDSSSESEDDESKEGTEEPEKLAIDINLGLSPWANAGEYYDERRTATAKEQKTAEQSQIALKNAEKKIAAELQKGLKQEKPLLHAIRRQLWFEKFVWFISSDGYLVIAGKDASQNEILYRRYLKRGDVYLHADLHGAPSVVVKNHMQTPDAPIPPSTLSQAGNLAVCASSAWDSKAGMPAYWVNADQVSKSAPTGEFLPTGSFMIRGKKNFLPPAQLILGFGLMFRISEESKAKHVKHRLQDPSEASSGAGSGSATQHPSGDAHEPENVASDDEVNESDDENDHADAPDREDAQRENPLQSSGQRDEADEDDDTEEPVPTEKIASLSVSEPADAEASSSKQPGETQGEDGGSQAEAKDEEEEDEEAETAEPEPAPAATPEPAKPGKAGAANQSQKKQPPKRGQRGKAKKIAAKYRDQDEEDRAMFETLVGATAGQKKAEAEAKAKAEKEAAQAAAKERRRAQHQKQQRETAEHEEVRKMMLEEGIETLNADEAEQATPLDSLVGLPLPGDEILEVIPVCGPYGAIGRLKYKVKLQPGSQKKGKAVKEVLEAWKHVAGKKGVLDEKSLDKERMWPREVELLKSLKPEEAVNCIPVGKVRVMVMGGSVGGGGGGDKGKGKGKGGGSGGKGKKK